MTTVTGTILKWLAKDIGLILVPAFSVSYFGYCLDKDDTKYMTRYRDKSSLYGKVVAEGEKYTPSWP